jgi:hypothetical protein
VPAFIGLDGWRQPSLDPKIHSKPRCVACFGGASGLPRPFALELGRTTNLRRVRPVGAVIAILSFAVVTTWANQAAYAQEADIPFRSIVPNSWKLLPRDPHSPGRRFVSPSGDAWLRYFAVSVDRPGAVNTTRQVTSLPTERVTYERRGGDWVVSSGYKGDRIFYRRAMLACNGTKWRHIEFDYSASEKRLFDSFVTRTSFALRNYQERGCE